MGHFFRVRSSPLPYGCDFKTLDMLIYSLWVMTDYHESKEHDEMYRKIHEYLRTGSENMARMIGPIRFDEHRATIDIHSLVKEAMYLGNLLGHSYKARAMYHWSKEDYDAWVAEAIGFYESLGLPIDDLLQ